MLAAVLRFVLGLGLLVLGGHGLVQGASRLAARLGLSPLVMGLTVVAYGTSAPELAVSLRAALGGQADISLGNVVGSNVFNVLAVLGLSAVVAPLEVSGQLVRVDVPIMIGLSAAAFGLGMDGRISRADGALLFAAGIAYTAFAVWLSRRDPMTVHRRGAPGRGSIASDLAWLALGLFVLVLGARWLVESAVELARALGLSELVIGLTIVAAGTSLPEATASLVAALRGEREMAVGNVVGSNIFNLVSVLGLTALTAPGGVAVSRAALAFDLPVMIAVAVACLPIFATGHLVARWEGVLFVAYYGAYALFLVMQAQQHAALPAFSHAMAAFAIPLTVITLAVVAWRGRRRRGSASRPSRRSTDG